MTEPLYILDTDTVTFLQAGRAAVLQRLSVVAPDAVFTTVITVREQLRGRLAAVDQAAEGTLVTSNRQDFDKVPGLLIEDWDR